MLGAVMRHVRGQIVSRSQLVPLGYDWTFVAAVDLAVFVTGIIAVLQRPSTDLTVSLIAFAVAVAPAVLFFVAGMKFQAPGLWASWMTATAICLFATSTPIASEFAPL